MTAKITESIIEKFAIELLEKQGYQYIYGPGIAPDGEPSTDGTTARSSFEEVLLLEKVKKAVSRINHNVPLDAQADAIKQIQRLGSPDLIANNETFHRMLTEGINVSYQKDGNKRGDLVWLIDFNEPENNDFVVVNQYTVIENHVNKRPDVVLFVNGLPLVVIELKNPTDENATVKSAFQQFQTYKQAIPSLFAYNGFLVISDGLEAKAGTISSGYSRFMSWKSADGKIEASPLIGQLETLIRGMLNKKTLLDLIRHFIVFEKSKREDKETGVITIQTVKKIAAYHQYYAVNRAVESTLRASGCRRSYGDLRKTADNHEALEVHESPESYGVSGVNAQPAGDKKGGVIWHTQGSGKSLSMVFYAGKIVLVMDNPTILVITDRNDLDDQLFDTFAASRQLLRQEPVQAENRGQLKDLLKVASGGVVFTTIQKFQPDEGNVYEKLSDRKNIIVIADEAHRTQYGFKAKTIDEKDESGNVIGKKVVYGFAKYMRDALPNATYLGFTGTPIESTDVNTPAVFGNYVDVYDIAQAVNDGATVRIYYENRLAKIVLSDEGKKLVKELDDELEQDELAGGEPRLTASAEGPETQKAKAKWTQLEALVGSADRIKQIAKDIITHFEQRQEVMDGKGMIVTMSRRIAAELYKAIIELKPEWHSDDLKKGVVKVVMTSASSDGSEISKHHTTKEQRRTLAERMKEPDDELKIVIVRDMWLTGFDVPHLHTLYIDKPMKGHNLMQAIARVNRVYKDKSGGLIVDYLGIASDLKQALSFYSTAGGKGDPALNQEKAVHLMLEKLEIVSQMFHGFDYEQYFAADTGRKLALILSAEDHILALENCRKRFIDEVSSLSQSFSIAIPHEQAMDVKDEVAFFQAVKARLVKFDSSGAGKTDEEIETAIRQVIDKALVTEKVIDVFDAAGIKKPDISILSEDFLLEVKNMKHKNIALEVLKKLLNDEIKSRTKKNLVQSKTLMEMLENSIKKYHSKIITASEVIEELIALSKEIHNMDKEPKEMGLSDYEYAFYTAVANNDSAKQLMEQDKLRELAIVLYEKVKENVSIDWTIKESVKAKLKVIVKRILRQYGYPPDMQLLATETVLKQAELIAEELLDKDYCSTKL
ncbi:MAG: type I restriction endonuclease subunit R [Treponema sp.]|jgi:type I restriction enzyme R subunit|nr:type I restriction endonuclease subunit R [Treponema sp.]